MACGSCNLLIPGFILVLKSNASKGPEMGPTGGVLPLSFHVSIPPGGFFGSIFHM